MKKIALNIDTSRQDIVTVSLEHDGKKKEKIGNRKHHASQIVLPLIESLLSEERISYEKITHIYVCEGPGSFTGLRVGVSVAQMIGAMYHIPVNDTYSYTPSIVYEGSKW